MIIQYIQRTMAQIVLAIPTALFESVAQLGCGLAGLCYEIETKDAIKK